jgi:hypothetical protein
MTETSLKMMAEKQYEDMVANTPINISDAASMLRKKISSNERPYDAIVFAKNNDLVDEWYSKVLVKLADKSANVPAGRVSSCFNIFLQGKELVQHQKYKDMLWSIPNDKVMFWIDKLKSSSVSDLHDMGAGVVGTAWSIVSTAIRYYFADKKWEVVYSKSTDPLTWDKLSNDNPNLMNGRPLPFGLSLDDMVEMEKKVMAVFKNPIEPH